MEKIITVLLLLALSLGLFACGEKEPEKKSDVIATVEGEKVYVWEYNFFLQDIKETMLMTEGVNTTDPNAVSAFWNKKIDGKFASDIAKDKAYEEVINFKRQVIFAKKNGAKLPENFKANLDAYIKDIKETSGEAAFQDGLYSMGLESEEQYRQLQEDTAYVQNCFEILGSDGTVTVSEEEIENFYNEFIAPTFDVVTAKHILISTVDEKRNPLPETKQKEAEKKAKDLHAKIKNGELSFDAAMKEYSEDPGLAQNPTGYTFGRGEMVEAFETTAFNLSVGEMSEPVLSEFGWHIILLTDGKTQTLQEAHDSVHDNLLMDKCRAYIADKTASYKVKRDEKTFKQITVN